MGTTDIGRGAVENALEHFGVKGMRWGVRKADRIGSVEKAKLVKRSFNKDDTVSDKVSKTGVVGILADQFNSSNKQGVIKENGITYKPMTREQLESSVDFLASKPYSQHAKTDLQKVLTGKLKKNLQQSNDFSDFLEHYGIKGMRWGVRRSNPSGRPVVVKTKAGKGVVKVSGGAKRPVSEDAINKVATRQKGKASTVSSLSNEELRKYNERAKLESEYLKYTAEKKSKGKERVKKMLDREIDSLFNGKPGPILTTAGTVAVALILKKPGTGKHRSGVVKAGSLAISTLLGPGTGKRRIT